MRKLGGVLFIVGFGSILFTFLGLEFKFLFWMDSFGEALGWSIRCTLMVLGALLLFLGENEKDEEIIEEVDEFHPFGIGLKDNF